jgi:hypothetical protein
MKKLQFQNQLTVEDQSEEAERPSTHPIATSNPEKRKRAQEQSKMPAPKSKKKPPKRDFTDEDFHSLSIIYDDIMDIDEGSETDAWKMWEKDVIIQSLEDNFLRC